MSSYNYILFLFLYGTSKYCKAEDVCKRYSLSLQAVFVMTSWGFSPIGCRLILAIGGVTLRYRPNGVRR